MLGHVACWRAPLCLCAVSNGILYICAVHAGHAPASHAMRAYTPFHTITTSLISPAGRVPFTLRLDPKVNTVFMYNHIFE